MIILIATVIFDYFLSAVLVGIAFFALFGHKIRLPFSRKSLFSLFFIFAILDTYYLPALLSLDATVEIGNKEIVEIFNLKGKVSLGDIFSVGWFNVILWAVQAAVGHFVGSAVYQKLNGGKLQLTTAQTANRSRKGDGSN
jgi:hypothetical protein